MPAFNEISPTQLMRMIGTPDAPVIIDTCIDDDFALDPHIIPTAQRCPPDQIETIIDRLSGKSVVTVCQKGKKLSQGSAAILRSHGIRAENLEGGNIAWHAQGLPRIPFAMIPAPKRGTLWVTRHRPKIDRIACPWLIRRFVDPDARFLFVQPSEVMLVAENFGAVPFDIEDTAWSHQGEQCTFDTMLARLRLDIAPLQTIATVVRGADTNRHNLAPQAAGLLAISVGLSRAYKDDLEQLQAGMIIYDALYRWARDGQSETHDWPGGAKA